jgi:hypothetical protein
MQWSGVNIAWRGVSGRAAHALKVQDKITKYLSLLDV